MLNKTTNRYAFELTDHLGNVRAVVAKNASTSAVDVLSYTDYYPHGGVLPGRNFVSSPSYKLGYQGQEKDAETNFSNFELRQMDARLGSWFNPDPMGQYFSPYLAMGNNPVSQIDPTGGWSDPDQLAYENDLRFDWGGGSWFDGQFGLDYQGGGSFGGSINPDGSFYSHDKMNKDVNYLVSQRPLNEKGPDGNPIVTLPTVNVSANGDWSYDLHAMVQFHLDHLNEAFVGGRMNNLDGVDYGIFNSLITGTQHFFSDLDEAVGAGFYGSSEIYHAVQKNAGDNNPYMYTKDEMEKYGLITSGVVVGFMALPIVAELGAVAAIEGAVVEESAATEGVYDVLSSGGRYIGQSKNMFTRVFSHFKDGKLSSFTKIAEKFYRMAGSTKKEREVYEQYRIIQEGISNLRNVRNPMGGRMDQYSKMIEEVIRKYNLPK
jgi:RHS repeat-associated protein